MVSIKLRSLCKKPMFFISISDSGEPSVPFISMLFLIGKLLCWFEKGLFLLVDNNRAILFLYRRTIHREHLALRIYFPQNGIVCAKVKAGYFASRLPVLGYLFHQHRLYDNEILPILLNGVREHNLLQDFSIASRVLEL